MMKCVLANEQNKKNKVAKNLPQHIISTNSFLVKSNIFFCKANNHIIEEICGIVKILTNDQNVIEREIYAGRCTKCNIYFIFLSDYENLTKEGKILCNMITIDKLETLKNQQLFSGYKNESLITSMGYNVQANSKLTDIERQNILVSIIAKKLLSISDVISFLEWLVQIHAKDKKYTNAIEKWKKDTDFIKQYELANYEKVNIRELVVKK